MADTSKLWSVATSVGLSRNSFKDVSTRWPLERHIVQVVNAPTTLSAVTVTDGGVCGAVSQYDH